MSTAASLSLEMRIKAQAFGLGFDLAGICTLGPAETAHAFDEWLEHTKKFAGRWGLDMARLGVHAAQGETSLMLAHRPDLVQMDKACEGFIGDASIRWRSKVPPPMDTMSPTGILGDARGSTADIGEKMFADRIEQVARMIEQGTLAG